MTNVIAHRGASKAAPENTRKAFELARSMGADWVELDVRRTQDGLLAVHHDPYLRDGRVVCDTPAADLPHDVLLLAEALDACAPLGVNIEIKNYPTEPDFDPDSALVEAVVETLATRSGRDRVLISAFYLPTLDAIRAAEARLDTAWLVERVDAETLPTLLDHGHRVLHPWVRKVTRSVIDDCHAADVQVNTWTCDDPARMLELIGLGIDGICTNVPDIALRVRDGAGFG